MIRISAAHMVKKQLAMSSDLILFDDERRYFSKPATTKGCERTFGYLDWKLRFCQFSNIVRLNGIAMFKLNSVDAWLMMQPADYVDELFRRAISCRVRDGTLDVAAQRALETKENKLAYLQSTLELGRQKLEQIMAQLSVDHLWTVDEIESMVDSISRRDEQVAVQLQQ